MTTEPRVPAGIKLEDMVPVFGGPDAAEVPDQAWCPGCGYGILPRTFNAEFDKLPADTRIIGVVDIGCVTQVAAQLEIETTVGGHGRTIAVATGIKRILPDAIVCVFIGDGGVAMEGLNETFHTAARAENISVFMYNNGVLADTGGQLTTTGSIGIPSSTTPGGREVAQHGHPIPVAEMLAQMPGTGYVARASTHDPAHAYRTQKVIANALRCQLEGRGMAFVDLLTTCPTSWSMTPVQANKFQGEVIVAQNPVGDIKPLATKG
ncbi:MAG TPA: thiamine pyrophosphate-dependent enzyme [Dehalococcoidia bacterium]|jgi:2-oxoglutarate ferredoxin oxidoreductase subunit beta|nr:thiamine pyrophosphate-dependent enzyme [Dehalococcoidia bacterium]